MTNWAGRQLGDYRIIEPIGAGGMGEVFLAEHVHLRKKYAVKVLPEALAADRQFVARFHDEARVMAELRHPGIVQVHYMGEAEGAYFLVMDYVTGPDGSPESLHDRLGRCEDGRLPEPEARRLAEQVAEALAYAHQRGVVHRDLKPANILLDAEGNAKLTDFGLAKAVGSEFLLSQIHQSMQQTLSTGRTVLAAGPAGDSLDVAETLRSPASPPSRRSSAASSLLGTYDYMAPEQRGEGTGRIDERTDIYAFGVLLYRVLTGRRPTGMARAASRRIPGLSAGWDPVIARCLEDEPEDRYSTAEDLQAELRKVSTPRRRLPRRILLVALAACLAAALALAAIRPWEGTAERLHSGGSSTPISKPPPPAPPVSPPPLVQKAWPDHVIEEVKRLKAEAHDAWDGVKSLDPGYAFGGGLEECDRQMWKADDLCAADSWPDARDAYELVLKKCTQLEVRDTQRRAALDARTRAQAAVEQLNAMEADFRSAGDAASAQSTMANAKDLLAKGKYPEAEREWKVALGGVQRAADAARIRSERWEEDIKEAQRLTSEQEYGKAESLYKKLRTTRDTAELRSLIADLRERSRELTLDLGGGVKMRLMRISEGSFMMGSKLSAEEVAAKYGGEATQYKDERPRHSVALSKPFYMGIHEVTRGQFAAFVKDKAYRTTAEKQGSGWGMTREGWESVEGLNWRNPGFEQADSHPVILISWDDAKAFCAWLSARSKRDVRLPTEAEWEYACRAGSTTVFSFGHEVDQGKPYVNWCDEAAQKWISQYGKRWNNWARYDDGHANTAPVGSFQPNEFGLYDMHGNAWEWCEDRYGPYSSMSVTDPPGPSSGRLRVLRGGGWVNGPNNCRSAYRLRDAPDLRFNYYGFRVVVSCSGVD
jgi:formylglycine-generating enzyme required for sulfatase activity/serine/threonine protein kinase